jgi:hypothetical protein
MSVPAVAALVEEAPQVINHARRVSKRDRRDAWRQFLAGRMLLGFEWGE